ncbi:putative LPXTG-motif cell wall anchor domain protein [Aspergillus novofumigatus IBT 16806]|uniref:Putative LPXTG-motif cell wall anchor domain protein n=1 Tax=Aspergillus novofumigatus (strain IBT 16806) TaxID=1392255 RepID=A0A2I1CKP8_ASPN1|nr:putative LPXTG-motif cell wall anchor domain protein [Aspergillus novofumigatus IBT 16806]PKX98194.1 putative LPXTG-motif cell wall anchor domain protein [Aspergillus novofumigatus IBT 16806]
MSKDVTFSPVSTIIPRSPQDDLPNPYIRLRRRQTDSAVVLKRTIHAPQRDRHPILARRSIANPAWAADSIPSSFSPTTSSVSPRLSLIGSSAGPTQAEDFQEPRQTTRYDLDDRQHNQASRYKSHRDDQSNARAKVSGRQTVMSAAASRDTGRAATLISTGTSASPSAPGTTITTTTTTTTAPANSSPSSASHPYPSSASSPRLPQSRFSFEYQLPWHKRALPTQASFPSVTPSDTDPTPNPQRAFLYDGSRRSVPTFSTSRVRNSTAPASPSHLPSPLSISEKSSDFPLPCDADSIDNALSFNASKRRRKQSLSQSQQQSQADVKRRMPVSTATYVQGSPQASDRDRAIHNLDQTDQEDGARTPVAEDPKSKNEDIFLNIARSDSKRRDSLGRSELRRHLRHPLHSLNNSPSNPYSALPYSYSASAHPLDDHPRSRHSTIGSSSRSTLGISRSRLGQASPDTSPYSAELHIERRGSLQDPRVYRHSALASLRSSRQASGSDVTERPRPEPDRSRQDGTESTLSTTAPSTVWDELEDLKSRIKKLELTGKLPPSSQAAISTVSGERPRTATTTVTTVSSSPNHNHKISLSAAETEAATATNPVHPLLQSALLKARDVLTNEVYKSLEAAVTDALALSSLLGTNKAPSGGVSVVNGYSSSDRQSRRKADSVCRSLTELCLALSDEQLSKQHLSAGDDDTITQLPTSANEESSTLNRSLRRSMTLEPEVPSRRKSTTHVSSRLEARRQSLANTNGNSSSRKDLSALPDGNSPSSPGASAPKSRLSRLSTPLRSKRLQPEDEDTDLPSPHSRSISRAMTDIDNSAAAQRLSPRQRVVHGYTASQQVSDPQRPQGSRLSYQSTRTQLQQPRTPTAPQSSIPLRRSLAIPANYTPTTSRLNILAGSRRYGTSGIPSAAGDGSAPDGQSDGMSSQQGLFQTRITAPSSKQAASYTPIQQSRARANSMGVRTFGLRQRPTVAYEDPLDVSID